MKKLFTILAFLFVCFALTAQDQIITTYGNKGVTNATASAKVAAYNYVFQVNIPKAYVYTYSLKLIDNTGSNTASTVFAGSLDGVYYKTIATIAYGGTGADTTIIGNITANPVSYKYLRFTVTPSDTMWVKSIWLNALPLN